MTSRFPGHPLFDTARHLIATGSDLSSYPTLRNFLATCPEGALEDWKQAQHFLISYAGTQGTYSRFRGEIQRFLLFIWLVSRRTLAETDDDDINRYMKFLKRPPKAWRTTASYGAFEDNAGLRYVNPAWRPFIGATEVKQTTLNAAIACLQVFFRTIVNRGYLSRSPMAHARKSEQKANRGLSRPEDETAQRLTDWQWAFLLESLVKAAGENPRYERNLFVVVTMKTLYLRVSELARRTNELTQVTFTPTMGDFLQTVVGGDKYWTLYIWGKGEKERWIPLPAAYMPYLKRYRESRGLLPYPTPGEMSPIVSHNGRDHPLGKRQVERLIEESLLLAAERMQDQGFVDDAQQMRQITKKTHYLRHTGASMDIEAGRPIRHVSEDLGHQSVAFTEEVYVRADATLKYVTGLNRAV